MFGVDGFESGSPEIGDEGFFAGGTLFELPDGTASASPRLHPPATCGGGARTPTLRGARVLGADCDDLDFKWPFEMSRYVDESIGCPPAHG